MPTDIKNLGKFHDNELNRNVMAFEITEKVGDWDKSASVKQVVTTSCTLDVGNFSSGEAGVWDTAFFRKRFSILK